MFAQRIAAFALISATLLAASLTADARVVTDHLGRQVNVPDVVNRVVTTNVLPFASATAVFLGGASKIIGIHPAAMSAAKTGLLAEIYPEILKARTDFVKGSIINIETLMTMKPDVVFVNAADKQQIELIENAGIPAVAVSASRWNYNVLETYDHWIKLLSDVFGESSRGGAVSAYAREIEARVKERTRDIAPRERKRVLFLFQYDARRIVTSGRRFFGQYWCDTVNAVNVAEELDAEKLNAQISMEAIYRWNPDIILITNFTPVLPQDLYTGKINDWRPVKAVADKQVFKMPLGIYRSYTPSADTPLTLLWLAKTIYPERFRDTDLTHEVKKYYKKLFGIELTTKQAASLFEARSDRAAGISSGR